MLFLKQSTASQAVLIGPFLDSTDGDTAETGLTIANTDIRLSKNGGNMAAKNSGGGTHDEAGWYTITLDATDTNTVGTLQLSVDVAGALPIWHEFQVVEEAVYDNFFASAAVGPLTAAAVNAECDTALTDYDPPTNAEMEARTLVAANYATAANLATVDTNVDAILVDTGTTLPATLATIDGIVDAILVDTSTTLDNLVDDLESRLGTPSDLGGGATIAANLVDIDTIVDAILVDTDTTIPGLISGLNDPTVAAIAAGVWDEARSGHVTQGTFGEAFSEIISGTVDTVTNTHTPTTTEFQADDITEATADHFIGRVVVFTTGALAGQTTDITDYALVGGIGQFTVTAMTEAPANNDQFVIF